MVKICKQRFAEPEVINHRGKIVPCWPVQVIFASFKTPIPVTFLFRNIPQNRLLLEKKVSDLIWFVVMATQLPLHV